MLQHNGTSAAGDALGGEQWMTGGTATTIAASGSRNIYLFYPFTAGGSSFERRKSLLIPLVLGVIRAVKYSQLSIIAVMCLAAWCTAAEPVRTTIWQGTLHLGDNPMQYSTVQSAGMAAQLPCTLDAEK